MKIIRSKEALPLEDDPCLITTKYTVVKDEKIIAYFSAAQDKCMEETFICRNLIFTDHANQKDMCEILNKIINHLSINHHFLLLIIDTSNLVCPDNQLIEPGDMTDDSTDTDDTDDSLASKNSFQFEDVPPTSEQVFREIIRKCLMTFYDTLQLSINQIGILRKFDLPKSKNLRSCILRLNFKSHQNPDFLIGAADHFENGIATYYRQCYLSLQNGKTRTTFYPPILFPSNIHDTQFELYVDGRELTPGNRHHAFRINKMLTSDEYIHSDTSRGSIRMMYYMEYFNESFPVCFTQAAKKLRPINYTIEYTDCSTGFVINFIGETEDATEKQLKNYYATYKRGEGELTLKEFSHFVKCSDHFRNTEVHYSSQLEIAKRAKQFFPQDFDIKEDQEVMKPELRIKPKQSIILAVKKIQNWWRSIKKNIIDAIDSSGGCVYIIHEREFINSNSNVYKVGRTMQILSRMNSYPKSSLLKQSCMVTKPVLAEKLILQIFAKRFIRRQDVGSEYFEGKFDCMAFIFNEIVQEMNTTNSSFDKREHCSACSSIKYSVQNHELTVKYKRRKTC